MMICIYMHINPFLTAHFSTFDPLTFHPSNFKQIYIHFKIIISIDSIHEVDRIHMMLIVITCMLEKLDKITSENFKFQNFTLLCNNSCRSNN